MRKLIKLVFSVFFIAFLLSPFFIGDHGANPEEYASKFEIENGSFLEIDGHKTFYIDFNSQSEDTILLLHGFGGSATNWLEAIPPLSEEGYRVVAVDLKGFGFSEKRVDEDYSHPSQVDFLDSFVENLELKNITLVGHSLGGNVATMYYQEYPEKVEKLVLVSSALMEQKDEDTLRTNALKILDYPILREYVRIVLKFSFDDGRVNHLLGSAVYDFENTNLQEPLFLDPTMFLGWEYVAIKMSSSSYLNILQDDVSSINVPVLIIWGDEDTWVPVSRGESLDGRIEDSSLELIENVGHLPMLEKPEEFVNILIDNI